MQDFSLACNNIHELKEQGLEEKRETRREECGEGHERREMRRDEVKREPPFFGLNPLSFFNPDVSKKKRYYFVSKLRPQSCTEFSHHRTRAQPRDVFLRDPDYNAWLTSYLTATSALCEHDNYASIVVSKITSAERKKERINSL